jgi:hypothetical protein
LCSSTRPCWSVLPIGAFLWRRNNTGWRKHRTIRRCRS